MNEMHELTPPPHWAECTHPDEDLRLIQEHPTYNLSTYRCWRCHGIVIARDPAVAMIAGTPDASFDLAVAADTLDALDRLHRLSD